MAKIRKVLIFLLAGALVLLVLSRLFSSSPAAKASAMLISGSAVGRPLTVGNYLFWRDNRNQTNSLYGYDLNKAGEFLITGQPANRLELASDGKILVWVQTPDANSLSNASVQGYDLPTGQEFTLIAAKPENQFGGIALDGGVLYYQDATPGHSGLYALNLSPRQERLISPKGQNPLAVDGHLLWTEEQYRGNYQPPEYSLNLLNPASRQNPVIIAKANGQFSFNAAGDSVVWAALPPASDQRVYRHSISQQVSRAVSNQAGRNPFVNNNKVVWTEPPDEANGNFDRWAVLSRDLNNNSLATIVRASPAKIQTVGFDGDSSIALSVNRQATTNNSEIYLAGLEQRDLEFIAPPPANQKPPAGAVVPLSCGQVYKSGYYLFDCQGRFWVNGVQFILPQRGINGSTFWDRNYGATTADIEYWFGQASDYLQAQTVRIFVDMPLDTLPGLTSPATLYDFALRANSRGLRVAMVLHNDTSWTLTDARKQWLADLVAYFKARNALSLIAYFNADNEINNHCPSAVDCYDDLTYVAKANQWVADFSSYVRSLDPKILLTVGISTEKADGDNQPAIANFFKVAGNAPTLAKTVDFIAPHNYGGGGPGIWSSLRSDWNYSGPIVLEEFGYPTDPASLNGFYSEGANTCRTQPTIAVCLNTAPYFLEMNARAIRENSTNGFAGGSAWMLADTSAKDCSSPYDYFTGLFATGDYPLCNGTRGTVTTTPNTPKATAYRLKLHHAFFQKESVSYVFVTSPVDNGVINEVGTLSYALNKAVNGQTIMLMPVSGNAISIRANLPALAAGAKISGSCTNGAPGITLDGGGTNSLTLGQGAVLDGVRIINFKSPQVKANSNSKSTCVSIGG